MLSLKKFLSKFKKVEENDVVGFCNQAAGAAAQAASTAASIAIAKANGWIC